MTRRTTREHAPPPWTDVSDDDFYQAMKEIPGYLDVTPGDLKEIYAHAHRHALQRIANSVRAADVMTAQVLAVRPETPLGDVAEIMARNEISGVPVVDEERRVAGVISEKDFCTHMGDRSATRLMGVIADCIRNRGCLAMTLRARAAGDIMTSPAVTVPEDAPLGQILAALAAHRINRLPVVDRTGRLAGIVSRADIVRLPFGPPRGGGKASGGERGGGRACRRTGS